MDSKENMELDCQIGKVRANRNSALFCSCCSLALYGSMIGMISNAGPLDIATTIMTNSLQVVGTCALSYNLVDLGRTQKQLSKLIKKQK